MDDSEDSAAAAAAAIAAQADTLGAGIGHDEQERREIRWAGETREIGGA